MFSFESKKDFHSLIDLLKFTKSFKPATVLILSHLDDVNKLLKKFLASDDLIDASVQNALNKLPHENYLRLISSPYICELLLVSQTLTLENSRPLRQQILRAIIAEIRLADPGFKHECKTPWTINSDFVLDEKLQSVAPALQTNCGIILNYQSYIHNTGKEGIGGYDHATALQHKERIETGKSLVSQVSPSALSLIENFTTMIQFRHNSARPNVVNSSTHTSIGLIRCDNFHKLHNDMPEIVDMLVHESIHQYLHLFEEQLFNFVDTKRLPQSVADVRQFPSPWSGNLLDIRSYTHAILVWYGLINFWTQFVESDVNHSELPKEKAYEKLAEAKYGFLNSKSVLDNLGECKSYLTPQYVEHVDNIQRIIKLQNGATCESTAIL